jgi:hypothetical protein
MQKVKLSRVYESEISAINLKIVSKEVIFTNERKK